MPDRKNKNRNTIAKSPLPLCGKYQGDLERLAAEEPLPGPERVAGCGVAVTGEGSPLSPLTDPGSIHVPFIPPWCPTREALASSFWLPVPWVDSRG